MSEWPFPLSGVTETVVTTRQPDGEYALAALGVHAPADGEPATAVTYGDTRTRRNFRREGEGTVQAVRDPELFVRAALEAPTVVDPVVPEAHAWVRVEATSRGVDRRDGTSCEEWALEPVEAAVRRRVVPTLNRGRAAVVEATVAASRLDVPAYDAARLRSRLDWLAGVVERCGGPDERAAIERIAAATAWAPPED